MKGYLILFLWIGGMSGLLGQPIKVACVGNSVTYGAGIEERDRYSYPARLQQLLGESYLVRNFGKSGATLLAKGHRPYTAQPEYRDALAFQPDIVVIHLGLNDTDPRNWPAYRDEFIPDYLRLIQSFREINPRVEIRICLLTPISHRHPRFLSGTRDWFWEIRQAIETVAEVANVPLVDLHPRLYERPGLLPDGLHPGREGAEILAKEVYAALTGDYGGLQLPAIWSDRMVIQREHPVCVQGIANRGEKVKLTLNEYEEQAVAGEDGRFAFRIPPLETGKKYRMTLSSPSGSYQFSDLVAGEVWLCSGQSNMAFRVDQTAPEERSLYRQAAGSSSAVRLYQMHPKWETHAVEWPADALESVRNLSYYHTDGWQIATPQTIEAFSAVAFAFGTMLADSLGVPVGLILNAVGGSPTEAWIDRKTLEFEYTDILHNWLHNDFIQPWVRERAAQNIGAAAPPLQRHPYEPVYLFETGIRPLAGYPVKGVIWYQGESNAHNIEVHEQLFPLLVKSWREAWKEPLPFYYVQLSGINRPTWPHFRDSQRRLMETVERTGMVVSHDKGDSLDVHPVYKKEIGERLARWALHQEYGYSSLVPSGPLIRQANHVEGHISLFFNYGDGLRTSDGDTPRTFEVAGRDGLFYPASVTMEQDRILLTCPEVKAPEWVRYGWQPFTRANLVNREGLPASTFRIKIE